MSEMCTPVHRTTITTVSYTHLITESYKQERSVAYYADKMFLTAKHLSTAVKEVSGKTAGEWIDSLVILEAKALLKSSEMSIQAVSYTHLGP